MEPIPNEGLLNGNTVKHDGNPYTQSVNNLSRGFLSLYSPPLVNTEKQLTELIAKQEFLIAQIHNENLMLAEVQYSPEIQDTFTKLKTYHNKLLNLKKDMKSIYERSSKLKKRALRLQQAKEKEEQLKKISRNTKHENEPCQMDSSIAS